jgi:hypothetical protein
MAVVWKRVALESEAILKTVLDTTGDILYANESVEPASFPIGAIADGHILSIQDGIPEWIDKPASVAHAASHKHDGATDVLALSDLSAAGNVAFAGKEAKDLVVYNKAGIPATPVLGKWYYETTTAPGLYICTSVA